MNKIMMKLFTVIMLMMFSMGVEAQIKVDLGGEKGDGVYPGGTIVEKNQTKPDDKGLVTVILTVTPKDGYTISQGDITVVSTYDPSNGTRSDSPKIAANLTPIEKDPKDLSQPRDYSFIVSSTFGVWVKEANFHSDDAKGGDRDVTDGIAITSLEEITTQDGHYVISQDITGGSAGVTEFSGTLEADIDANTNMPYRISDLTAPLFETLTGTVKNLVLEDVGISGHTGNTGAIACTANGDNARIYNVGILSGSVGGTGNTGGLVGQISGKARVINCYSFATITGGTNVGGIVGNNNATTTASSINTMVMNCMFYGDITGGNTVSPVFGGNNIANLQGGLNTFNYYAYDKLKTKAISNNKYNSALAVEEKYLNRFEFYRLLLNSNKKLAAFYATGDVANADQMAKWVLETADRTIADPKPYPILKVQGYYPSIINIDAEHAPKLILENDKPREEDRKKGGKLGKTLSVAIATSKSDDGGGQTWPSGASVTTTSLTLQRTDKDFDRFNYNYDKVQLPYYNDVGTGNYTGNKVVTGWKITAITAVDGDPYTAANYDYDKTYSSNKDYFEYPNYNFADRKSSNKDLYSVSKRVFSQGAYFDVPYGVTSITIEPYWGKAAYIADANYDVVYKNDYSGKQNVTQTGTQVGNDTKFNGQTVHSDMTNALKALTEGSTVYDNAVVLVGNLHLDGVPSGGDKAFTMMSVDDDNDHEPDYSLIYHHKGRTAICPIRFDFLNIPGTAQAQKPNGASLICNFTIFKTKGWFEVTNTSSFYSSQLEYENIESNVKKSDAPLILQGGVIDQFVSTQRVTVPGKTIYIHVGGNVWIKEFGLGTHSDGSESTPHVPVSVTGGEFPGFYLTGTYNADAKVRSDNAECYISGGYFHEVAGASLEQIDGSVHWQIYNADIDEFFGGGINEAKPIKGNVTTDIYNSHVTLFCGGPKFGNMQTDKTVITNAEGCTFGKFFGAGYGGTSLSKKKYYDNTSPAWGTTLQGYYTTDRGKYFDGVTTGSSQTAGKDYGKKGLGVATDFDYEFFVWSSGSTGGRFFVKFASFSLAQCNDVVSNLKGCTINQDFYGGGSLGKVIGKATSVLDDCTVKGNVFGGGYSATLPTIEVRDAGFTQIPNYNKSSGMFEPAVLSGTTTFTWKNAAEANITLTNNESGSDLTDHYLYTDVDLTALGKVGATDLTIKGNTFVKGKVVEGSNVGGVFGGGDESAVLGNTKVDIQNTAANGINHVYGGGNTADVLGDAKVYVKAGNMVDVFGGGKGETTVVKNDVVVTIGKGFDETTGNPNISGDVYGGSALGAVNASSIKNAEGKITGYEPSESKKTNVYFYAGTVEGSVFGGGLGQLASGNPEESGYKPSIAAQNFGDVTVTMEGGTVREAVYGGANINGVLKADATVTLHGSTIGTEPAVATNIADVVFGGGKGAPTLVNGNVTVNVGTEGQTSAGATIYGNVYGGSALGNTNASKTGSDPMEFHADKTTNVNLYAGTINGNVFGGGLGRKAAAAVGIEGQEGYVAPVTAVESFVGGNVNVLLDGVKFVQSFTGEGENRMPLTAQIFGANNLNGTPKGHVKVQVERTVNTDSEKEALKGHPETALEARTTYDVAAVYGGGNQADYIPVDPTTETQLNDTEDCAEVIIRGCDKTSIEYVYGGGNAAAVPATQVTVESAYIIHQLFGGGNGKSTATFTNPGANIGLYNNGATEYGTGETKIELIGGQVHEVYGGSNTLGNVRGGTSLKRSESNNCTLKIGAIYGAGQEAPMDGDVNIILECMPEEFVPQVFGGAKNAIVNGNVSLTVTSGKYGQVFGGNNLGGSINGSITVNVYEDGCLPLMIGELYGGGYKAPYSIYGCTRGEGDTWTANESGKLNFNQETEGRAAVEVNVYSCTSIGKVFGGGYQAPVIGNTHVWVNMMKGLVDDPQNPGDRIKKPIGKIARIFGGGNEAVVKGNTTLDIGTATVNIYDSSTPAEDVGVNIESGSYLKPDKDETEQLTAGIYGGGNAADVEGSTTLNIGTVNQTADNNPSIKIQGDIFGGGFGETTHVTGNVVVNIGKKTENTVENVTTYTYEGYAIITGDVYGGSAKGKVNTTDGSSISDGSPTTQVNFYGGTIQDTDTPSGKGNIYGGGLGEDNEGTGNDHAADVYGPVTVTLEKGTTNTVVNNVFGCNNYLGTPKNTVTVNINGGTVNHSVYGGGNQAAYTPTGSNTNYPAVNINNGTITENVFGGGLGETATATSNPHVTIGDDVASHVVAIKKSVYGGGSLARVDGSTYIFVNKGTIGTPKDGETVYGGAEYGNIYGGGFGSDTDVRIGLVKGNTNVTVNDGTILHNIYGGGAYGSVGTYTYASEGTNAAITGRPEGAENTGKTTIRIIGGTIGTDGKNNGMVFGSSRGDIDAIGAIQDNMAWVYDTDVQIGIANDQTSGPTIHGSLYGGGENGHVFNDASVTMYSGMIGIIDTSVDGGSDYPFRGNVYGGGCGTDKYYSDPSLITGTHTAHDGEGNKYNITAGIVKGDATVTIDGGHVVRNVYGAGAMGSVTGKTTVNISGNSQIGTEGYKGGEVYAAARGEDDMEDGYATVGSTELNISGGTIWGSAFGGGQLGTVKGSVAVNVSGGVIKNDVYGGGALANTNTDNWNTVGSATTYVSVAGLATETYRVKEMAIGASVVGLYTYDSGTSTYVAAAGTAVEDVVYYEKLSGAPVAGYYTQSDGNYTRITNSTTTADGVTTYYKKVVAGSWADGKNDTSTGTTYKTTVSLTGGLVGNVYGGGLGNTTTMANVYGDVTVTVNQDVEDETKGVAFIQLMETATIGGTPYPTPVPVSGRVFGGNNHNGTPTGNITVHVYSTRQLDNDNNILPGHGSPERKYSYDIQSVYGGGNQADYLPADGKKTQVIIDGCNETSIEKVYGGGNSAVVPETDVLIKGAYDIGYAFGGGNGDKPIKMADGSWRENEGAIVIGLASIVCQGGKIGQVFGGGDAKGSCGNTNAVTKQEGDCPLHITRLYGAGNKGDVSSVNIVLAACSDNAIDYVHGGSYNAHVHGDVHLTITSGILKNVYGGNDARGGIEGNIIVDIEETSGCKPIIIQNLVGGGNEAPYPGTKTNNEGVEVPIGTHGKITVNVKSATRIDNIYGGSYMAEADADTEVNINMIKGNKAGETVDIPKEFSYIPNITKLSDNPDGKTIHCQINDAIGTIGNVYGGGNLGLVKGKTTVNIGASDHVEIMARVTEEGPNKGKILDTNDTPLDIEDGKNITPDIASTIKYNNVTDTDSPFGVNIMGSVYGGGREADVTDNTYVNICAKDNGSGTYVAVTEGTDKVKIAGNVFGGGKGIANSFTCDKAMIGVVDDGATVTGTGESATYTLKDGGTTVTIGHGEIGGSVYGGGEIGRVERNTKVTIGIGNGSVGAAKSPVIEGEVYGGGQGVTTHGYSGLVRGNSNVTIEGDSWIKQSVYGAGKLASLGRYWIATTPADATAHGVEIGMPWGLKCGGQSTVTIQGYAKIGPAEAMTMPKFSGNVFGAGKGILPYDGGGEPGRYYYDNGNYTWESYADESKEDDYLKYVETLGITNNAIVTIGGNAFVMGSVYGGSENGTVFADTEVNISGGQIGCGKGMTAAYTSTQWESETPSGFEECAHWSYEAPFAPYDKYADQAGYNARGGAVSASDGHTFYGNVFGGGSGKDPYKPGKWHRLAGFVGGNTKVNITGGHILTSVYGGNEMTDVGSEEDLKVVEGKGKCTINMVGGTLGVPRTEKAATEHPVTCYLFGAGKGDQRTFFNTWTNVSETEVNVTGDARIFGSVFGGGEDGHVLGNAKVNIGGSVKIDLNGDGDTDDSGETFTAQESLKIGTTGTSYVDGNVFGGGRGFSGEALTAGSVGGNVEVNISGGTMLGSVYGGGRLASVGTYFTAPDADEYGQLQEDEGGKTYGHINVNISGGTIGNATPPEDSEYSKRQYSGNVYGGCMGRTTLINGDINPIWPELAQSKFSTVNIYGNGTHITRNVYGGAEFGVVRENAKVTIGGKQDENGTTTTEVSTPTIDGYVYGAGHGSDDYQHSTTIDVHWGGETRYFTYTPMQWAGCVGGNTTVNLAGGSVKRIYGGGELASVGVIDYSVAENANGEFSYKDKKYAYTNIVKHDSKTTDGNTFYDFGLSWPYKFTYVPCNPTGFIGGLATVNVTGGTVTEYVYGGGKGQVAFTGVNNIEQQRYTEAFCANVRNTQVTIGTSGGSGDTPTIGVENTTTQGMVYGGAEDGHVYEDANVTIHHGRIVHTVFGGGKGEGTYTATLLDPETGNSMSNPESVHSWTAGKVYGNTNVTVNGGSIGWFVYGGGNKASVGKGNYSGGADDYSTTGYGELPSTTDGVIWTATPAADSYADYFQNSGKATVNLFGGTVGDAGATAEQAFDPKDKLPYGSVFGGSRGTAAMDVGALSPRYKYVPDFFLGYVNKAIVNIGGTSTGGAVTGDGPTILGSVYGGGQDGHVRNSTEVRIFKGSVTGRSAEVDAAGRSGHVFGAGSGIGTYDYNKVSNSSGSVTCTTLVEMNGGHISGNIWGGGAMASVGPPKTGQPMNEQHAASDSHKSFSYTRVDVKGGTVGGNVYGASRGPSDAYLTQIFGSVENYDKTKYATDIWSDVNITGGTIGENVYGGGQGGIVKESTTVSLTGGSIAHDAYGGGQGTANIAADVLGNTTTELNKGVADDAKGCIVDKVFGCNDLNGTPKGHVTVHVYATQTSDGDNVSAKVALPPSYSAIKAQDEGYIDFMTKLIVDVTKTGGLAVSDKVITDAQATINGKNEAGLTDADKINITNAAKAIDDAMGALYDSYGYDVTAVYGGGDLAPYEPTSDDEKTEVIIEGCSTTSIKQVYGGGNAASVPATDVTVKSCYIIGELFGGGNGKDNYQIDNKWYENPGAHIGYTQFATYDTSGSHGTGADEANKYTAIVPRDADDSQVGSDAAKAYRQEHYRYGTGVASSIINGGHVHKAYGGSNEKGNISGEINSQLQQVGTCTIVTDGTYGGSKSADTDATIIVVLDCVEEGGPFYGGSYQANMNSDVNIHITNGHYTKVFGGNDRAGTVNGKITITIEEYGCTPIEIDELYAGGNLAPYSVYGFKNETQKAKDANGNDISDLDQRIPYRAGESGARTTPYWDPRINIISATRIGAIYGGGYGAGATLIGNPHINVNMTEGKIRSKYNDYKPEYATLYPTYDGTGEDKNRVIPIGTIGSIYGGGNLASVEGDTYVEIGTGQWIASWDANGNPVWESTTANGEKYSYKEKTPAVYYSQAECNEYNAINVSGYIASGTELNAEQVTTVNTALGTTYADGQTITEENANAYNATLTGARKTTDVKTEAVWAWYDADGVEMTTPPALAPRNTATITGNVFGGGKGVAETTGSTAFTCPKGMIGVNDEGLTNPAGGTSIIIANGTVGTLDANNKLQAGTGNVYGGGEVGRVEKNTAVIIGVTPKEGETIANTKFKPTIYGNVFGAGKGVPTHGYSALVRGNSNVTIQGFAKIGQNVYGGGEIASVGRYNVVDGRPTSLKNPDSGNCIVTVLDNAEVGPNDMTMTKTGGPDNAGHVFGAGKGAMPYIDKDGNPWPAPWSINKDNGTDHYSGSTEEDEATYLEFVETLGLATQTEVTIGGNAFVKGSVFGGAEQGFVQHDTHVTIEGDCQIGNGYVQMNDAGTYLASPLAVNRRYTADEWSQKKLIMGNDDRDALKDLVSITNYTSSLPECASWKFGQAANVNDKYAAHDIYADSYNSKGGSTIADNGSTFYGNVFGGGSGYFPYKAGKWHWKAGDVGGNTLVEIKGGHILTNVYGGNELTNVTGKCTVEMSGGTIGVPRTLGQIAAHPVTCYLFGAGKGDPRVLFNKQTNAQDVEVKVSGGWIYGSVFGGGEDGHVMRDVAMTISDNAKIGTWGTSYVDGNVFGGGRGFAGDAYTAGNVAGSVNMTISGGTMLGSIYGGGRLGSVGYGLYDEGADGYGLIRDDEKMDNGSDGSTFFTKGRGHVEINITGGTIGNTNEFIMPNATNISALNSALSKSLDTDFTKWTSDDWKIWKSYYNVPNTEYDTSSGRVLHTKGGNVYAGGMGRYTQLDGSTPIDAVDWWKLGNVKSTALNISGSPWIMGNVYGGGELGAVVPFRDNTNAQNPVVQGGTTTISITGGTIGTEVTGATPVKETVSVPENGNSNVLYTYGSVYGGGMGMENPDDADRHGGEVGGNTTVSMSGADTEVRASVFGGGEMAIVDGNTTVTINNGKIGRNEVKTLSDEDAGYVMFGGATMGNVYGGGKGILSHTEAGQVKGNTNVTISGGNVYHMVYGGGALGSVGDFKVSDGKGHPTFIPIDGVPYGWDTKEDGMTSNGNSTGTATVTITGGTIGISGRDNGLVFGSSRGGLQKPEDEDPGEGKKLIDPYDRVAWVNKSVVNIGTAGQGIDAPQPQIKGSVYGGGENGHNNEGATVNVYSGTIGITDTNDLWYNFGTNETVRTKAQLNRGNVYGAGSGSDTYTGDDGAKYWNPKAGMVAGNTFVNIYGGHIGRSVYGGGAMASVGTITNAADTIQGKSGKHASDTESFALSWPYKFEFAPNTGKAMVNVTGGHIGTRQLDGGDVYGSSRGEAGDRYKMAHLAWVNETEVNINYSATADMTSETAIQDDFTTQCITGSVHGSGENGYVYGDAKVTLNEGLIGHSLYGAGKGNGTYTMALNKIDGSGTYDAKIYSLIAGKVMGNTYVTMNGGRVGRNVYGGGNMGSVGKGNYSGGKDDYNPAGYGETINGDLWTSAADGDDAWQFLNSGKTTVNVVGGIVGYIDETDPTVSMKNELPYGNVFGGSAGEAAPNIDNDPRYLYSPAFYSGYVNETDVTIGGYQCKTDYGDYKVGDCITAEQYNALAANQANWELVVPTIYASVYGGGQDGHVRRDTKVTVIGGEIGVPYTSENQTTLKTTDLNNPQWMHRGNIYGGGSGITKYKFDLDGDGKTETNDGSLMYGGKPFKEEDYSNSSGSVTRFTEVNVLGGTIHRNVYGGGSMGSVGAPKIDQGYEPYKKGDKADGHGVGKQSLNEVIIGGAKVGDTDTFVEAKIGDAESFKKGYGGNVFGAGRGNSALDENSFATSIWTKVLVKDGAYILGNVFGGGDAGKVKQDTDVQIGEKAEP